MEYINTNRSENNTSPFALIWIIFIIVIFVWSIISGDFWGFFFFFAFFIFPILYFLDIFLWYNIGKEVIYTKDKNLIIKKIKRVFPRKKKIRFDRIEDMYLWKVKGPLKESFSTVNWHEWTIDREGTFCIRIKYNNGCKYHIGRYLDEWEAKKLLEMLKSEIVCTHVEPSLKSKIIDKIVRIFIILLLAFLTYTIIWNVIGWIMS